ncbi:OLC1v1016289C1 [Oldenlandia corymbosa var. corymbosa]|uniref:OLC1v1016289C1 n=1 Tax=Oldenlandia corymbosa var. corymbosa TaxID=529605 RepID=A0AAV1E7C4_OLDCO|nr:OLC1v1016289C1 [Oldenlandia corymbosa var. corymbosa]
MMNPTKYTRTKKAGIRPVERWVGDATSAVIVMFMGHSRKNCPDLKHNDGKESERPLVGQKRVAPKWFAIEPLADDMVKQKGRGKKVLPNSQCEYCKRRGHKAKSCPALERRLQKRKEAAKQDNGKGQQQIQKGAKQKQNKNRKGNFQLRDEDENDTGIPMSKTKWKGTNQLLDGDENDRVVLLSDGDGNDPGIPVSRTKRKGKNQLLDGDENDPVVLVSRSKGKGKFQLRDEDENDPAISVSRIKRKEIHILVEDDDEDFPIIRVSRTRRKGKFHILDEDKGADVPVTTTVDGEDENVVPQAKSVPCEYCEMTSHRTAQCPQEQLTRWLEKESSDKEHDDAADSALEPRADCSGNLDMDERKDQNKESSKFITAPDEPAKATENNGLPEDVGNSVVSPVGCDGDREVDDIRPGVKNSRQNLEKNPDNSFKLGVGRSRKARYRMLEGLRYHIEVGIKYDGTLKPKYDSCQGRIKLTTKSTRSRRHNNQANEIDEKADKVHVDVVAEKRKSTKKSTRCRQVHGRAKEVDGKVDSRASTDLSVNLLGCISNYPFPNLARNPNSNKMSKTSHSNSEDDSDFSELELDERTDSLYNSLGNGEVAVDPLQSHNPQDRFVYPPITIVVNLARKLDCGKFVGPSGRAMREKFLFEGFSRTKVELLWDDETGHSAIGIVHFRSGFDGFTNALVFHQAYKNDHHGKQDWPVTHNDSLYVWVAQENDYASTGIVGRKLSRCAAIKSFDEIQGL